MLAWIAVLPVVVALSTWMGRAVVLTWISGAVVGLAGALYARGRDRDVAFAPEEKRLVARAVLTGAGTGDPDLDGSALRVLDARKRVGQAPERIALSVVLLSLLAAPIVAGMRSSVWWLLMLPLEVALTAGAVPYLALDVDDNIWRIEAAPPTDTEH